MHHPNEIYGPLGYKPPALEVFVPIFTARAIAQTQPAPPPALALRPTIR
jgi:putative transposase